MVINKLLLAVIVVSFLSCTKNKIQDPIQPPVNPPDTSFTNPLLSSGADPWVIQKDTTYYYTQTFGNRIALFRTNKMSALTNAPSFTVWTPPGSGASGDIWAPEMHYLQNKWYIYFAADTNNVNSTHRIFVLENTSADPISGSWVLKGKVADATNKWAIDATELEYNGNSYLIWSGWQGNVDGEQDIFIASLSNPWTISGSRVLISAPTYSWEKNGSPPIVNEGPEVLKSPSGKIFLTYSASGCWTDDYALGLLSLQPGGDPMNPANWTKSATPVFTKKPENGAFGPGHNAFFKSRDGNEDWIIYHANSSPGQGCGNNRNPRMQKFTWNADGTPNFGEPVKINVPIKKPSGE